GGEWGVGDRGAAIAGLQESGGGRETPPGCAEGAHRARVRSAGVVRAFRAHTPGAGTGRACTRPALRRIRPALSRGRAVLRYETYRTDCDSRRLRHQTATRRVASG